MLFHDRSVSNPRIQELRQIKEHHWLRFMNSWEQDYKELNNDELVIMLQELQEYVSSDFPMSKQISQKSILSALDDVCCIAASLAVSIDESNFKKDYVTKKLYSTLRHLQNGFGR